jgi:uncharacterized protein (DUF983 family)
MPHWLYPCRAGMALHAGTQHDAVHPRASHTAVAASPGRLTCPAGQVKVEQACVQHVCVHALGVHDVVLASPAFFVMGAGHVCAPHVLTQQTSLQLALSPHVVVDARFVLRVVGDGHV